MGRAITHAVFSIVTMLGVGGMDACCGFSSPAKPLSYCVTTRCFWASWAEEIFMVKWIPYAVTTTLLLKGVLIGLAIAGAVVASACRKGSPADAREGSYEPRSKAQER